MTAEHLQTGIRGEEVAASYLLELGWTLLERNVSFRGGELDIVARDGEELVVVEVRTRSPGWMQRAEDSVGPRKIKRLVRAGRLYMERCLWNGPWRIDLVAVTLCDNVPPEIERFEDITDGRWDS